MTKIIKACDCGSCQGAIRDAYKIYEATLAGNKCPVYALSLSEAFQLVATAGMAAFIIKTLGVDSDTAEVILKLGIPNAHGGVREAWLDMPLEEIPITEAVDDFINRRRGERNDDGQH